MSVPDWGRKNIPGHLYWLMEAYIYMPCINIYETITFNGIIVIIGMINMLIIKKILRKFKKLYNTLDKQLYFHVNIVWRMSS